MFDEQIFIKSLTVRPEDAKSFCESFKPEWLEDSRLQVVLQGLFDFVKKFNRPPDLATLRKCLEDSDKIAYENRLKPLCDDLEALDPEISMMLYVIDKAKQVSIIRSLQAMIGSPGFQKLEENFEGAEVLQYVSKWMNQFIGLTEDKTYDLKTAFQTLLTDRGYQDEDQRIQCGIEALDGWCGGGLRRKNLAIILAPTGAGKSATLTVIAHKIAAAEQKNVWFISNELPINEVSERFLSRVTGRDLTQIMDNPSVAYKGLKRYWDSGLDKRLMLTEINRECSTDEIEAEMEKTISLTGWKPDVIVLDFMERMKPNLSGYKRDQSWEFMGATARDLVRFAKRKNVLIWTAAQTNRGGLSATKIKMEHAQGATKHLQEAAAVITLNQDNSGGDNEEKKFGMHFTVEKLRHSRNHGQEVTLECDLSKMSISNVVRPKAEVPISSRGDGGEEKEYVDARMTKKSRKWKDKL